MENIENNDYKLSFFRPTTKKALKNRNMAVWLILIWATAVFGFQILLKVMGKPVPEDTYIKYEEVWSNIENENATDQELCIFAKSVLQVLGKVYIKGEYKHALSNAFSWAAFHYAGDNSGELLELIQYFEDQNNDSQNILDEDYIIARNELQKYVKSMLDINETDPRQIAIPFSLKSDLVYEFTDKNKELTTQAMSKYLIHNRSVLTEAKFLGFPFHYFYTAVFLLILFIGLCWLYCFITDKRELKENASKQQN